MNPLDLSPSEIRLALLFDRFRRAGCWQKDHQPEEFPYVSLWGCKFDGPDGFADIEFTVHDEGGGGNPGCYEALELMIGNENA